MLFHSYPFLFVFLPLTYAGFLCLRSKNQRYAWLAVTGYFFYSFWSIRYCALMALSTLISFAAGVALLRLTSPGRRKLVMCASVAADLTLLGVFKYGDFFLGAANDVLGFARLPHRFPLPHFLLPVGISFYTFHTITYVVDCYRGAIRPTRNFLEFSCYVSLFAQLVAGPIARFGQVEADLATIDRARDPAWRSRGWSLFVLGLAKKVCLADVIASMVDPMLAAPGSLSTLAAWLCALGFAYQVYFDFSGYSDMAIGLGTLFGIRLPQNFNSPFQATSVSDFWRRWHMSLSSVLRDYVYTPLGGGWGSRFFAIRNLFLTMLLCGLWHGANWTFVVWGALQGAFLAADRVWMTGWRRMPRGLQQAVTFLIFVLGLVVFRSPSLRGAGAWYAALVHWQPHAGPSLPVLPLAAMAVAAVLSHRGPNTFELDHRWSPQWSSALAALLLICLSIVYADPPAPFLYFQF